MRLGAIVLWMCLWISAATAASAQTLCRLALVLALDVSSSVDADEHVLQRNGLADALQDTDIQSAFLDQGGLVALAVYEWSGKRQSVVISDWLMIDTPKALAEVAQRLRTRQRSYAQFPTAMGYALGFGATLLERGPACTRRVIDVSGDGANNDGFRPKLAYQHFPFDNITVNGLAVLTPEVDVVHYYQTEVRHGPGAFVETAEGYEGYRAAMIRKLFRELNDVVLGSTEKHVVNPG